MISTTNILGDSAADGSAEEKFRLAVEACPSGMLMTDSALVIVLANKETERLFGYRRNELIGRSVEVLVPERLRADHLRFRAQIIDDPQPHRVERLGLRRDGTEVMLDVGLYPIATRNGLFMLDVIVDISDRKRMDRLKDEFVFNVSHELRTPLTSIAGSLGLLVGGAAGQLPGQATRLITIAQNNCLRLVRLINDVLDIEKIESGKMVFHFKRTDARALVEQVIEANRGYADGFQVRVRLDAAAVADEVYADSDRLAQVITNLLSNAIKFSPPNEEVVVAIDQRQDMVRIAIRDHGPGIPSEFRSRIFEKFAQAQATNARQRTGTGLGLSIVKQIVTRLDGTVGFEDADGGGTVFHVDLPGWAKIAAREIDSAASPGAVRILLCEDDPDLAFTLREGLRRAGFSTDFAHSPGDANARTRASQYAAVLVDLDLPENKGGNLVRQLRKQPHIYRTPIIVMSADRAWDKGDHAWTDLNVHECVEKPVDVDRLAGILERNVARGVNGRPRILHVDDDPQVLELVARALASTA
ncbi:MAG TPA: ATP-binding protein, partial [Xanthobacteraceae bacterium]|nr:ATP-binding protein [Xanthobacteraceae bacterium]